MSLQELDPIAKSLATSGAELVDQNLPAKTGKGKVFWLREHYPQFFTEKVMGNRTAQLPAAKTLPKKTWAGVTRKLTERQKTQVALHKGSKDGTFYFKFPSDDTTRMLIGREVLVVAVAVVKGSEWVQMKAGGHTLCLHRAELRIAFKKLES